MSTGAVPTPLTCEEAEALLPLVADGALDEQGDPALFAHLARCPACQESLARHDLVSLALTRAPVRARLQRIPLPLPWAIATAAGITCAASLAWIATSPSPRSAPSDAIAIAPEPTYQPPQVVRPARLDPPAARAATSALAQAVTLGPANDPASAPIPETEVIIFGSPERGNGSYVLLEGGQTTVIPMQSGRSARASAVHPVGLTFY